MELEKATGKKYIRPCFAPVIRGMVRFFCGETPARDASAVPSGAPVVLTHQPDGPLQAAAIAGPGAASLSSATATKQQP